MGGGGLKFLKKILGQQTTGRQIIGFLDSDSHSDMANRSHHIA
jgi:hypothetical protein